MTPLDRLKLTRRQFLAVSGVSAAALAACSGDDDPQTSASPQPTTGEPTSAARTAATSQATTLARTPACTDDDDVTIEQTEGPFFTPDSPERTSLREAGVTGMPLVVSGVVLSTACQPVAGALLDFWQADDAGEYDNIGFKLRGHQFADSDGRYTLETILPALYPGRTRHIHVKVQAPDQPVLTTQLYFPGEPANASDGIFDEALVMDVQNAANGQSAAFDFVLEVG